ncbi:MAG TPA: hypothetical protein VJR49_02110 [Chthoniobacterales bacterium]|nr:hypothetical protein [Chthoniobacterales bacterium]
MDYGSRRRNVDGFVDRVSTDLIHANENRGIVSWANCDPTAEAGRSSIL